MITRITDLIKSNRILQNLQRQQIELDTVQNKLSTGQRIQSPSDDPSGATNQMYFRTRLEELKQFQENTEEAKSRLNLLDIQLSNVTDILQRVRKLTVQASNGIYQGDNFFELRQVIATEVDQHLRALLGVGNQKDSTGRPLFSGYIVENSPFQIIESDLKVGDEIQKHIVDVKYKGDIGKHLREIDREQYMDVNLVGNQALWATNMTLTASVDSSNYVALSNQKFRIDGKEIQVLAGDRIDDIIEKINTAGIPISASKVGQDSISLHTTQAHEIWLEDVGTSSVLKDIGLLSLDENAQANDYAENAQVSGLSIFGALIKLKNDLIAGDQLEIGGQDLGNIDQALNNVLHHRAEMGARVNRLEAQEKKIAWNQSYTTELLSQNEGVDIPEAIMNLKWLETVNNYALNVGARIIRPQLLDFLR